MSPMTRAAKRDLRRLLREGRRAVSRRRDVAADDAALALRVVEAVHAAGLRRGSTVTLYESVPDEPPTVGAITALQSEGIRVLVPLTLPDLDLDWVDAADPARRPLGRDAIGQADLVLTPGLSVDRAGTRLGQGGGCYDRALPRRAPDVTVVVLLHPEEFPGPELPRAEHDIPVNAVLTVDGLTTL
jgi:5-formyltetrahydrofolate cyclo-ligase